MTPACAESDGTALRILFLKVRRREGGMQKVKNKNTHREGGNETEKRRQEERDRNEKKEGRRDR